MSKPLSKRLQVLLDEAELREVREAAQQEGVTVSEWARRAMREARRRQSRGDIESKLRAIRVAMRHEGPTADIDQMLAETERGYAEGLPD